MFRYKLQKKIVQNKLRIAIRLFACSARCGGRRASGAAHIDPLIAELAKSVQSDELLRRVKICPAGSPGS
jgi:hypothetical protein